MPYGVPRTDAERVANHWGVSLEEAYILLEVYPVNILIPERGYGLTNAAPRNISGYSIDDFALSLQVMEDSMPMKAKAKVTLCTETLPTGDDLADMYEAMTQEGFHMTIPAAKLVWKDGIAVPTTTFTLRKGSPIWPALIAILPTVFVVGLVAYGITRLGEITKALLPILLVAFGGTIVIVGLLARPAEKVATAYVTTPKGQRFLTSTVPAALPKTKRERFAPMTASAQTETYVEEMPKCDFCDKPAMYDGATSMGPWAYMCEEHFHQFGRGLGTGKGQKLVPSKALSEGERLRQKLQEAEMPGETEKAVTMSDAQFQEAVEEGLWYPECPYCGAKTPAEPDASEIYCAVCHRRFKIINPYFQTIERELGWKDFMKGNRIQASIDANNWRIEHRNVSPAEQKRLNESLKTDWKDLVEYQKLQSWAFASGLINKEEAELLYRLYGGGSPSAEKWDNLMLAEKIAATRMANELLGVKIKKTGYSTAICPKALPQTFPPEFSFPSGEFRPPEEVTPAQLPSSPSPAASYLQTTPDEEREILRLLNEFQSTRHEAKKLWNRACEHEGIPPTSSFVVFSDDNPYKEQYEKAMTLHLAVKHRLERIRSREAPYLRGKGLTRDDVEVYVSVPPYKPRIWVQNKSTNETIFDIDTREEFQKFAAPFQTRDQLEEGVLQHLEAKGILKTTKGEFITISERGDSKFNKGDITAMDAFIRENKRLKSLGLRTASGWVRSKGTLISDGNGGAAAEWEAQTKGFYYTILNGDTGEIVENAYPYVSLGRAQRGATTYIRRWIRKGLWEAKGPWTVYIFNEAPSDKSIAEKEKSSLVKKYELGTQELEFMPFITMDALLDPAKFPARTKALESLKPYTVAHIHSDGDLTVVSGGKLWVVTTEGEVFERKGDEHTKPSYLEAQTYQFFPESVRKTLPPLYSQENVEDPMVWVKFFTPWTQWTWYGIEFDGEDTFFGWVVGFEKELGYFSLSEMQGVTGPGGLKIERDIYFKPKRLTEVQQEYDKQLAVIPNEPLPRSPREGNLDFIADSPELMAQTIDMSGWREKINETFQEAVARTQGKKE